MILKSLVLTFSSVELSLAELLGQGWFCFVTPQNPWLSLTEKILNYWLASGKYFLSQSGVYWLQVFPGKSSFDFTNQHRSSPLHRPPSLSPPSPASRSASPRFALLSSAHRAPWGLCCRWPFAETEAPTVDSAASSLVVVKRKSSSWVRCFGCCEVPPRPLTLRFSQRLNF